MRMTQMGDIHKKRGANSIKTGLAMLVLGVVLALGFSYGQDKPGAAVGWFSLIAFASFIVTLVGIGKWREGLADE